VTAAASPEAGLAGWIHIEAIRALVHHTSAVIAAVVLFALVGFLTERLMRDGPIKHAVRWVDELVLLGLFIYFAYELFTML
jgi:hypothetical protein